MVLHITPGRSCLAFKKAPKAKGKTATATRLNFDKGGADQ